MILELREEELDLIDENHVDAVRTWNILQGEDECNFEHGARRASRLGDFVSALPSFYHEMELPI